MPRRSLGSKILLLQLTGCVFGCVLFALWIVPRTTAAILDEAQRHQQLDARRVASGMAGILADASHELERIAAEPTIRSLEPERMEALIRQHGRMSTFFPTMIVADIHGQIRVAPADAHQVGQSLGPYTSLAEQAINKGQTQYSQLGALPSGRQGVLLATPIQDANQQTIGVLLAPLGREHEPLLQFFANVMVRPSHDTSIIYVVDQQNRLLIHSDYHAEQVPAVVVQHPVPEHSGRAGDAHGAVDLNQYAVPRHHAEQAADSAFLGGDAHAPAMPIVDEILSRDAPTGVILESADTLATSSPIGATGWHVIVQRPLADVLEPSRALMQQLLLIYLLIIALSTTLLLGWLKYLLRPISQLAQASTALRKNQMTAPLPPPSNDEIGDLIKSFTAMRNELGDRQQALQDALTFRDRLIDALHDGLCVVATDGKLINANPAFAALVGLPHDGVVGMTPPFPFVPITADDHLFGLPQMCVQEATGDIDSVIQHQSGEMIPIRASRTPVRNDEGAVAAQLILIRDLRNEHRVQQRLLQAEKTAALGRLVAGVAHELNNPLAAVLGYAELLHADRALPPQSQHDAAEIVQQALRARRIVQDLLVYGRPQEPTRLPVDIHSVLRSAVQQQQAEMKANKIIVEWDLQPQPALVFGDVDQLHQVMLNLIQNAMHALASAPLIRRICITTRMGTTTAPDQRDQLAIHIQDNGPGIAADIRAQIFEPFFTTKVVGQGTGLGLSIVQSIVESHGGSIDVESTLGEGATFTIWLPAAAAEIPPVQGSGNHRIPLGGSGRILVVDDERVICTLIERVVKRMGYTAVSSTSACEARDRLANETFQAVICDVKMPDMTGPELYQIICTTYPELAGRVVFMTGDVLNPELQHFLQFHQLPALAKPFNLEALHQALQPLLLESVDEDRLVGFRH